MTSVPVISSTGTGSDPPLQPLPPPTGDGNQTPRRNTRRDGGGGGSTMQADTATIATVLNNNKDT
jgi:hypothetical protein